ncbi:PLDc N-terminal domain-containing protein [Alteraurantiacibacter aquimixticola]|uniref:Cardiolipin synthase N-terminal domain-containing protein n=1 Tax=Alteraurantiacibacter aquimixticola TaxID=2489173 RepID=A0A4V4U8L9_9SPHN|nr:PLDc N-terminal domain-containing protein [Alteraurantiacibacter aquimixticola]TIX50463.1 hypothetical protein E5222_09320 [Alteraurantiacibacter aquimixticola]
MEILGLLVLILDIYALYNIAVSGATLPAKLLWGLGIIVLPVIGFIVWLLAGPRGSAKAIA